MRNGNVSKIVISYKDRLTRFGYSFIAEYCRLFSVPIIEIEQKQEKSVQESLVDDMMTLIACFSGKLYGMRSKRKKFQQRQRKRENDFFAKVLEDEKWRILTESLPKCFTKPPLRKLLI